MGNTPTMTVTGTKRCENLKTLCENRKPRYEKQEPETQDMATVKLSSMMACQRAPDVFKPIMPLCEKEKARLHRKLLKKINQVIKQTERWYVLPGQAGCDLYS